MVSIEEIQQKFLSKGYVALRHYFTEEDGDRKIQYYGMEQTAVLDFDDFPEYAIHGIASKAAADIIERHFVQVKILGIEKL